jgi:hypothetical protein
LRANGEAGKSSVSRPGNPRHVANRVFVAALTLLICGCGLKFESALRQQFADYRGVVVTIRDMQLHDPKVVRIAPTFTRLQSNWSWPRKDIGFSGDRWNKYRALFEQAGITGGIRKDDDDIFYFVSSEGLSVGSATRGFGYTQHTPRPTAAQFDACPRGAAICYIPLEKSWHLFQWTE